MEQSATKGPDEKYCHECGAIIRAKAEICPKCGVRQGPPPSPFLGPTTPNGKNRIAAAVFGIVLGSFGIHKFYLGHIGLGILYLLFFWTGIPGIVGIIEGVIYLTMSDEEFAARYGQLHTG